MITVATEPEKLVDLLVENVYSYEMSIRLRSVPLSAMTFVAKSEFDRIACIHFRQQLML